MKYTYEFTGIKVPEKIKSISELKNWLLGFIKYTEKKVKYMVEIKHHNAKCFHFQVLLAKNILKNIEIPDDENKGN